MNSACSSYVREGVPYNRSTRSLLARTTEHILNHNQPPSIATEREKSHTDKSPVLAVFTTPELCEHILINLDIYNLSRAKSVCRQFSEVINGPPLLQQNLFPSPRSSQTICATLTTEPSRKLLIGPKTAVHPGTVRHPADGDPISQVVIYEKHPALQVEFWPTKGDLLVRAIGAYAFEMRKIGMSAGVNSIVAISRMTQDSVLQKTYICQPPVRRIRGSFGNSERPKLHIDISDEHGITFGHSHKAMMDFMPLYDDDDDATVVRNSRFAIRLLVSFDGGVPVNTKEQRVLESLGSREVILGKDADNDRDVAYEGKTKEHKKPGHLPWFQWRV